MIEVTSSEIEGYTEIDVKDNGIGIPAEYLDNIFQVFKRLHTRERYDGTGIGLAICKKIAERHNALIVAKSDGVSGTTMVIKFRKMN